MKKDAEYQPVIDAMRKADNGQNSIFEKGYVAIEELVADRQNVLDTMNAWFCNRETFRKDTTNEIMNAVRNYLRTCRVGGMPSELSEQIENQIQHMCDIGIFAEVYELINRNEKGEKWPS